MRVNRCAAPDASMWPMQLPDLVKGSANVRCGRAGRVHDLIPCDPMSGRISDEELSSLGTYEFAHSSCGNQRSHKDDMCIMAEAPPSTSANDSAIHYSNLE